MRKRPGVTYEVYEDATLYMVGYMPGSDERELLKRTGTAVVGYSQTPPYDPVPLSCRFLQSTRWDDLTHDREGNPLDEDDWDIYDEGVAISAVPGRPYMGRVWFDGRVDERTGFLGVIESYEQYMLDGYTTQENLEREIAAIAGGMS